MNKMTVAILALALTGSVAFAQGQGNGGGRGGNRGGNRGGARGGAAAGQVQPGGAGGAGAAGMQGGGQGGFGGGQGGFGGAGMGAGMGGARNGQLQRTIERLKADTPRDEALKKIEAKDKDAYAKVKKAIDDANAQLAELAKKAEVELPDTAEQQKAKALEFLAKEKDAIDKLLETDKTDSASAMQSFNELAQKNKITITPNGGRGALNGQQAGGRSTARGGVNTNAIRQIQEKFPEEYAEAQKLREDNPTAYREKMRELQNKLNSAN